MMMLDTLTAAKTGVAAADRDLDRIIAARLTVIDRLGNGFVRGLEPIGAPLAQVEAGSFELVLENKRPRPSDTQGLEKRPGRPGRLKRAASGTGRSRVPPAGRATPRSLQSSHRPGAEYPAPPGVIKNGPPRRYAS
jgi:hypothetical protein